MNKVFSSPNDDLADIFDGATIMIGACPGYAPTSFPKVEQSFSRVKIES